MAREDVIRKLESLGVFPGNNQGVSAEILEKGKTIETLRKEIHSIGGFSASSEQFIFGYLEKILKSDEMFAKGFFERATNVLDNLGIRSEHVQAFFKYSTNPSLIFNWRHGEYEEKVKDSFYERVHQFALDELRNWLGF